MENSGVNIKGLLVVFFFVLVVALSGYWWFVEYAAFKEQHSSFEKQRNDLKKKLDNLRNTKTIDRSIINKLEKLEKLLEKMKDAIPKNNKVPEILKTLEKTKDELNEDADPPINIKEVRISPMQPMDSYTKQPIEIVVQGRYHDIGRFLSKLENLRRFDVNNALITLNPQPDVKTKVMMVNLTLRTSAYMLSSGGGY